MALVYADSWILILAGSMDMANVKWTGIWTSKEKRAGVAPTNLTGFRNDRNSSYHKYRG